MEPYTINISSMQQFMSCRWRWVAAYVLNRVPRTDARPLRFGKLLHLVFEDYLTGKGDIEKIVRERKELWHETAMSLEDIHEREIAFDAIADLEEMREPMALWRDQYPFQVPILEVEAPFEIPHPFDPSIRLRGRPDRVGVLWDQVWHVQNRGLAAGVNFAVYVDLARRHYHEHVYAEALAAKYCEEGKWTYGGTVFNLMRKLKYRTKQTKANPLGETKRVEEMFWQHPMPIDLKSWLHHDVMLAVLHHAYEMRRVEREFREHDVWPPPNERMNGGPYGNRIDEFYRVLTGEITLDDDRYFKDRPDMYAPAEQNAQ